MIRVLVAGSEGLVGQRLVAALAASDWAEPVIAENLSADTLEGIGAIANCTTDDPALILSIAQALAAALQSRRAAPLRLVHLGSMTVYGAASGLVDETAAPVGPLSPYAAAQFAAEQAARGCKAVVLRSGVEYGPGCIAWGERVGCWLLAGRIGDLGPGGEGCCNLIYIDDLIAALIASLRLPGIDGEIFNVAAANPPSWNGYFGSFAEALGRPTRRISGLRLWLETRLLAVPLKVAEILLRKLKLDQRIRLPLAIPPSLPATCRQTLKLDVARAEAVLGLRWTPMAAGLREAARAMGRED